MITREDGSISRTQLVNGIVAALGVGVGMFPQLQASIPPSAYPWLFVGLSVVNAYLRTITTQAIK